MPKKIIKKKQANQFKVDPRQAEFIIAYCDPKSETFSNALQSALKVGYSQEYAESITTHNKWLSESVGNTIYPKILKNSINNLEKFTSDNYIKSDKVKLDATKFSLQALNKEVFGQKIQVNNNNQNLSVIELNIRAISEGKPLTHSDLSRSVDTQTSSVSEVSP